MEDARPAPSKGKGPLIKATVLALFIVGAIAAVRFTSLKNYLTPEGLGRFLAMAGFWGPVIFVLVYAVGVCLFLPGRSKGNDQ